VGDDLGVGFGYEDVALGGQFPFQFEIVFDDAVVDYDDAAGAVAVGVGVLFGGAAVGGPAGVAYAVGAVEGIVAQDEFDVFELAGGRGGSGVFLLPGNRRLCRLSRSRDIQDAASLRG